jgi:cyclic pyranopterin phosphate synthase
VDLEKESNMDFTHFDEHGNAIMVDISHKDITSRIAIAKGKIVMSNECYRKVKEGNIKKGDVLSVARIAGIMGAKKCSELIPLCHSIPITKLSIDFNLIDECNEIEVICTVKTNSQTGVEMEALTGVQITLLTIYDMCKAVDKSMIMKDICLDYKNGGKSGEYKR